MNTYIITDSQSGAMMKTYTIEEVIADIKKLEGIDIQIDLGVNTDTKFFKLYSEVNIVPCKGNITVDQFKKKIDKYIRAYKLPNLDVLPDLNYDATFYYKDGDLYKKEACMDAYKDFAKVSASIKEKSSIMLIYLREEEQFFVFEKETH